MTDYLTHLAAAADHLAEASLALKAAYTSTNDSWTRYRISLMLESVNAEHSRIFNYLAKEANDNKEQA